MAFNKSCQVSNPDTATLECPTCGALLLGDEPRIVEPCLLCKTEIIVDPDTGQETITIRSTKATMWARHMGVVTESTRSDEKSSIFYFYLGITRAGHSFAYRRPQICLRNQSRNGARSRSLFVALRQECSDNMPDIFCFGKNVRTTAYVRESLRFVALRVVLCKYIRR